MVNRFLLGSVFFTNRDVCNLLRQFRLGSVELEIVALSQRFQSSQFRAVSADPNQEHFTDGMTDELITDLVKIRPVPLEGSVD
jgi:hypothetical protein